MRKGSIFRILSLIVRSTPMATLFFLSLVPRVTAGFADKHIRLYLSYGWNPLASFSLKDEMSKAGYDQVSEPSSIGFGDVALLYSFNPKFSIGVEAWVTGSSNLEGHKTLPLTLYAYDQGSIDTTTYTFEMKGQENYDVVVVGPTIQWTLASRKSRQLYIRGMIGVSSYSANVNRYATWFSGERPSIWAYDWPDASNNAYGVAFALGGDVHASWVSLGLEGAIRYSQTKTIEIQQKRADLVFVPGHTITPAEGGVTMPSEKRKLSFWGVSLGIVLGIHAF